jgi:hypothetical protein
MKINPTLSNSSHSKEDIMNSRFYNKDLNVVHLYKDGMLVDMGVRSKIAEYRKQGYVVKTTDMRVPMDNVVQREFDTLWACLTESEKSRLHDIAVDDEMSTAERLMLLKSEIVRRPKRTITVTHRVHKKRPSLWSRAKAAMNNFVESLIPEPVFAMAHF